MFSPKFSTRSLKLSSSPNPKSNSTFLETKSSSFNSFILFLNLPKIFNKVKKSPECSPSSLNCEVILL